MPSVLTINGGSSSIRFAVYEAGAPANKVLTGKMQRIGQIGTTLSWTDAEQVARHVELNLTGERQGIEFLLDWLEARPECAAIGAVGHRVVFGMLHCRPQRVTSELLAELKSMIAYDPEHLPREIELLESLGRRRPQLPQVLCFDTAFHHALPRVATQLSIPRRYEAQGVRRYGFHGLSYTYMLAELARLGDPAAQHGRVILAHLGNGASLAAVRNGTCIDTSMGFTPAGGVPMGTRAGDLDPGLLSYLAHTQHMSAAQFQIMVNEESGLLGVSECSSDARELLALEAHDVRAREALDLFCYQIKKWIGAFAAALGGLDTLAFAGGIGENAAPLRARICAGLEYLGIEMCPVRNKRNARRVSTDTGSAVVRVIATDEESVIANATLRVLGLG